MSIGGLPKNGVTDITRNDLENLLKAIRRHYNNNKTCLKHNELSDRQTVFLLKSFPYDTNLIMLTCLCN